MVWTVSSRFEGDGMDDGTAHVDCRSNARYLRRAVRRAVDH